MWNNDEDYEELSRGPELAALNRIAALPSPPAKTLADIDGNAVLIDASGSVCGITLPRPFPPRIRIPKMSKTHEWVTKCGERVMPAFDVIEFELSSVQDGKAIYR